MYLCEPVCKRMAQKRSSGVKGIDLDGIVKVREKASWMDRAKLASVVSIDEEFK